MSPIGIVNFDFTWVLRGREGFGEIMHLGFIGFFVWVFLFALGSDFPGSKCFPEYSRCVFHLFTMLLWVELGLLMIRYTVVNSASCSKQNSVFVVQSYLIVVHDLNYQYTYSWGKQLLESSSTFPTYQHHNILVCMVADKVKAWVENLYNLLIKWVFPASQSRKPWTYVLGSLFLCYAPNCWFCVYIPLFVTKNWYSENYFVKRDILEIESYLRLIIEHD